MLINVYLVQYGGTALDWAEEGGHTDTVTVLRVHSGNVFICLLYSTAVIILYVVLYC